MNKILFGYLFSGYISTILKVTLIFYCLGLILNLFEEIEFFKNIDVSIIKPITLSALFIPNMIIKLFPFIIFISSMWFLLKLRNNKDLLILKVHGHSNFKIFFILACTAFFLGWIILFLVNPITSKMIKYYELTKAQYSRDIDHLISINKNGLWMKENTYDGYQIITADETRDKTIKNVSVFILDKRFKISKKIYAKQGDVSTNNWILSDVIINTFKTEGIVETEILDEFKVITKYDFDNITSLFNNFDTMSFLELALDYKELRNKGYNKIFLDQNLNTMLSMPFFLFIMTALAAILTMNTLKKSNNFTFILVGLITCIGIYYFKDLSLALGQTNRISLSLAAWMPIVAIGLFSSIGILQINEK
mgnify:CR=1 FL=1